MLQLAPIPFYNLISVKAFYNPNDASLILYFLEGALVAYLRAT